VNTKGFNIGEKKFTRKIEDFTCSVCGTEVQGTGYTDHCPRCLWSKHVDVFPGDRKAECGGLMKPIGATQKKGNWRIFHQCQKCRYERFNDASPDDDFQKIIELSSHPITPIDQKGKMRRK